MPRSHQKIAIRPKKGVQVSRFTRLHITKALITATANKIDHNSFMTRIHPGSNIIILSTDDEDVIEIIKGIKYLPLEVFEESTR